MIGNSLLLTVQTLFHKWIFKDRFDAFTHRLGFGNAPSITHVPAIGNAHRADTNNTINCNGSHSHCAFIEGWVFLVSNNNKQGGGQNLCHRHPRMMVRIRNNVLLKRRPLCPICPLCPLSPLSPLVSPVFPIRKASISWYGGEKIIVWVKRLRNGLPCLSCLLYPPKRILQLLKLVFGYPPLTSVVWKCKMKMHSKSRLF